MCRVLEVSPAGFYSWSDRAEARHEVEDRRLGVLIREAHERSRGTYGSPRIHAELQVQGVRVSRKRVSRMMRELGLRGWSRQRRMHTTDSNYRLPLSPNILDRDVTAEKPNERWVGDVTYLRTPQGWLNLAVLLDLRQKGGHHLQYEPARERPRQRGDGDLVRDVEV